MQAQLQQEMDELDRRVRLHIYRHFADTGEAPTAAATAHALAEPQSVIEDSYRRLAAGRAIVLAPATVNIWMAHPFSAVPTPYPVKTRARSYWANCAWDALGIPAVLGVDSETVTRCADCSATLRLRVKGGEVVSPEGVIHFAVPPRHFWDNIGFT